MSKVSHFLDFKKWWEFFWEFDPGSGWTLAACLRHASGTVRWSRKRLPDSRRRV